MLRSEWHLGGVVAVNYFLLNVPNCRLAKFKAPGGAEVGIQASSATPLVESYFACIALCLSSSAANYDVTTWIPLRSDKGCTDERAHGSNFGIFNTGICCTKHA